MKVFSFYLSPEGYKDSILPFSRRMKGIFYFSPEGWKDSILTFLQKDIRILFLPFSRGVRILILFFTLLQRNERILFLPFSRGMKGFYFYLSPVGWKDSIFTLFQGNERLGVKSRQMVAGSAWLVNSTGQSLVWI